MQQPMIERKDVAAFLRFLSTQDPPAEHQGKWTKEQIMLMQAGLRSAAKMIEREDAFDAWVEAHAINAA